MQKLKNYLLLLIIIPTIILCGCDNFKPSCNEINSVAYYYGDSVQCELFNDLPSKTISMSDLTNSKLDKNLADSYAQITLKSITPDDRTFHLYIEYLYFKVYMNESSEFDMNVNITISNIITENNVGVSDVTDREYTNTLTCHTRKDQSSIFKVYVNRVIASGTGTTITIDILTSEIYLTNPETTFKWCIYDFKIYGESRAYSKV